jgi:hypothetical protein
LLSPFLAALALAFAQAGDAKPRPPPAQQKPPSDRAQKNKLSAEDEALVKDLALVENVDLLKDLDLFEGEEQGESVKGPPEKQQ